MRTNRRWLLWPVLAWGLGGCTQHPAPPEGSMVHAVALPATSAPTVPVMETAQTVALASDAATRAAREQTLRVQAQLRARASAEQQAHLAAQRGDGNERCIAGQKMRRVANGWVQAGAC